MSQGGRAAPGGSQAERGDPGFEAQFFRQLQEVTTRIHETDDLDQLMLAVSADICNLFDADRMTLYALNAERDAIISRIKTGLNTSRELKLPLGPQSLAGYVAQTQRLLNIADVYDEAELRRIDPTLQFLKAVDERTQFRTKQMLVLAITHDTELFGVMQLINTRNDEPFSALDQDGAVQLCKTLATAIRQRQQPAPGRRKASPYDGLVSAGALSLDQLQRCEEQARAEGISIEQALLRLPGLSLAQIGHALARFFGVAYEPASPRRLRVDALHAKLKREFIEQQLWLPLEETPEGLVLMCIDPEAVRASRVVAQIYPRITKRIYRVTTRTEFDQTFAQFYGADPVMGSIDQMLADLSPAEESASGTEDALVSAAADNELVKFVNRVILDAHAQGASDIHIEPLPGKEKTGIRFRIDGSLVPYVEVPAHFRQSMVARLKIMCDLDISERRKPQDGKIKFKRFAPLDIELRVATIPSAGGVEDVVMRILAAGEPIPLEKLGLTPHNRERVEKTVSKPYGLFYVCGPTGSGKTTTLHSILKFLNRPDTKIWTAEDPVEITQKGLRQVQINKKAGIDFALVMRAFLRADPDIIMVGESRDHETVAMGVEASLTGHLVFSTLHTNSAPESIVRLLDMGMDPFNFADALLGILAQRLAKRLCDCKQAYVPDAEELHRFVAEYADPLRHTAAWTTDASGQTQALLQAWTQSHAVDGQLRLYRTQGCARCNGTGYKGRVGLHELLVTDERSKELIQSRARVAQLFAAAVEAGMRTLKMDGMEKVLMGLTDLKQVRAVCVQ